MHGDNTYTAAEKDRAITRKDLDAIANGRFLSDGYEECHNTVSYTHLDVYKRQEKWEGTWRWIDGYKRYIGANGEVDNDVSRLVSGPYLIKVYKWSNYLIVYAKDEYGNYTVPVKAMITSCGNNTPTGTYYSPNKFRWLTMVGGSKAQWCTQILGDYLFHSVPYRIADPTKMCIRDSHIIFGRAQATFRMIGILLFSQQRQITLRLPIRTIFIPRRCV